jgi:hypothetical protein
MEKYMCHGFFIIYSCHIFNPSYTQDAQRLPLRYLLDESINPYAIRQGLAGFGLCGVCRKRPLNTAL